MRSLEHPTEEERRLLDEIIRLLQSPRLHLRGVLYPERLRTDHLQSLNSQDHSSNQADGNRFREIEGIRRASYGRISKSSGHSRNTATFSAAQRTGGTGPPGIAGTMARNGAMYHPSLQKLIPFESGRDNPRSHLF
ncbi:MAG: hypothetical protein C4293_19850 [Nitrospiraceae bacterium]